jgi:hypothetical protein
MRCLYNILASLVFVSLLASTAQGATQCFLYGSITDTTFSGLAKGKSAVSNMIRLHMDANTVDYCQKMISSYCRNNILDKGDVPSKLNAYFSDEKAKRTVFTIDKKCKVKREDGSSEGES